MMIEKYGRRIKWLILQMTPYLLMVILYRFFLKDVYLLGWMVRRNFVYIWLIVGVLTLLNRIKIANALAITDISAIIIGQVIGTRIKQNNLLKINEDMPAGQVYRLQNHQGFYIWLLIMFLFVIGLIIYHLIRRKRT